jgi:mannan endo-1,4-beta-mannosidase
MRLFDDSHLRARAGASTVAFALAFGLAPAACDSGEATVGATSLDGAAAPGPPSSADARAAESSADAEALPSSDAAQTPDAPAASSARSKVLDYIASIKGKKTISGQHNKFNTTPAISSDWIKSHTGKQPGLWSADFGFGGDAVSHRADMIAEAKNQWKHGAIVQIMYHNCVPTRDELCSWDDIGGKAPQHLSDTEWGDIVKDGTPLNQAWKQRLDALSPFFADLKAAGVAPLFRPLHEMNQGVFWWGGRGGAGGTRRLFQITHDYLVKTKGFDHIIWVWDIQDFGSLKTDVADYDPGTDYYDIAALDVYDGGYDQAKYDAMRGIPGGKPIAIGECQHPPTSALLAQQPDWAFFMLWPDYLDENASTLPALYTSANVITEEQMPGWQ